MKNRLSNTVSNWRSAKSALLLLLLAQLLAIAGCTSFAASGSREKGRVSQSKKEAGQQGALSYAPPTETLIGESRAESNQPRAAVAYPPDMGSEQPDALPKNGRSNLGAPNIGRSEEQNLTEARLSDGFGPRIHPITHQPQFHTGQDIAVPFGTPIVAAYAGRVKFVGWARNAGLMVALDHGEGYVTHYDHMSQALVSQNQVVSEGQIIGRVGSTGRSTGPHLHFEVRFNNQPVQPEEIVRWQRNKALGLASGAPKPQRLRKERSKRR